jgi:hypothetical protein
MQNQTASARIVNERVNVRKVSERAASVHVASVIRLVSCSRSIVTQSVETQNRDTQNADRRPVTQTRTSRAPPATMTHRLAAQPPTGGTRQTATQAEIWEISEIWVISEIWAEISEA